MKTKVFFAVSILLIFTACIKDYHGGGPNPDEVELTRDNYLYEGDLERFFLQDTIAAIDNRIQELEKTPVDSPDYNDDQAKITKLQELRSDFKPRLSQIFDLSSVGLNFPIPCDQPNGKCVPVRLEFLLIKNSIKEAFIVVKNSNGKNIAAAAELTPFPEFESDLLYLRIPVVKDQERISVLVGKKDVQGNETMYEVFLP